MAVSPSVNPPAQKYSTLPKFGNDVCVAHPGSSLRGDHVVVTMREPGLRWTRQRRHEMGRAGRVVPVSLNPACRRAALFYSSRQHFSGHVDNAGRPCGANECAYGKTVWSWPSLLRSSRIEDAREPDRVDGIIQFERRGRPERTRLPGEHGISRPTTAQGRPCVGLHLYAAVRFFLRVPFAQRTAGASRHPAFPAPSWLSGQHDQAKLG